MNDAYVHMTFKSGKSLNNPKKSSLHLIQVREGNLVDVIAGLEDTLPAPN